MVGSGKSDFCRERNPICLFVVAGVWITRRVITEREVGGGRLKELEHAITGLPGIRDCSQADATHNTNPVDIHTEWQVADYLMYVSAPAMYVWILHLN